MPKNGATYVLDMRGILSWSNATGNEQAAITAGVLDGSIQIYNRTWREFCDAYPDQAEILKLIVDFKTEKVLQEHRLQAAALAEQQQATFGFFGLNNTDGEWTVAAIAVANDRAIITDRRTRIKFYDKLGECHCITMDEYLKHVA
ncbi:hypothetical protein ILT44_19125 [Microvirga sp. BT689]|jgi:hypothetical protein|uniref:hypothetical protein n=1 Tax=Microvirga arvi TaxID=2778731 RepID=UPI00194F03FA|nr:hypothetical protein [Microvirga arvi]MBM6582320.1 hypothetical protein [Microvirga arvi]